MQEIQCMTRAKVKRFSVPPLFEEVSRDSCPVYRQDVSRSKKELWLIRAPLNFDCTALNDVKLDLDGDLTEFSAVNQDDKKYEAVAVRDMEENETHTPYLLLPSTEGNTLIPGPAFRGQIVLMESLSSQTSMPKLPDIKPAEAPTIPQGLKQRFTPFGSDEPRKRDSHPMSVAQKGYTQKQKEQGSELVDAHDEDQRQAVGRLDTCTMDHQRTTCDEVESERKKKMKKKKSKRKHGDDNDVEVNLSSSEEKVVKEEYMTGPKKKKKKKKKSQD